MDQKNTIVKCTANPNCLFNHNGICDNYVITIGADGSCQEYVETALKEDIKNGAIGEFKGYSITKPDEPIQLKMTIAEFDKITKNKSIIKPMSDHLCDISCMAATYAEDGKLYCSLIQDFPERPLRCSAYDDGGCDCPNWDKNIHGCALPKCCWR